MTDPVDDLARLTQLDEAYHRATYYPMPGYIDGELARRQGYADFVNLIVKEWPAVSLAVARLRRVEQAARDLRDIVGPTADHTRWFPAIAKLMQIADESDHLAPSTPPPAGEIR